MFVHIAAAWPGINTPRQLDKPTTTHTPIGKPRTKISALLRLFVRGWDLNRIDAERHCERRLASTVSRLENRYGIVIARRREKAPRCTRYWLDTRPGNTKAAKALLEQLERRT